jgi:hypothetical protein
MMKKTLLLAGLLASVLSSVAYAGEKAICAGDGKSQPVAIGEYTKRAFDAKCSANVFSHYADTNLSFGVVAGSSKGKNTFGGGTGGGGIKPMESCDASTGCAAKVTATTAATARDSS